VGAGETLAEIIQAVRGAYNLSSVAETLNISLDIQQSAVVRVQPIPSIPAKAGADSRDCIKAPHFPLHGKMVSDVPSNALEQQVFATAKHVAGTLSVAPVHFCGYAQRTYPRQRAAINRLVHLYGGYDIKWQYNWVEPQLRGNVYVPGIYWADGLVGNKVISVEFHFIRQDEVTTERIDRDGYAIENANQDEEKRKEAIEKEHLPTGGQFPFEPPKKWKLPNRLPKDSRTNGFIDKSGNIWVEGPSRTLGERFEWDVQLRQPIRGQAHVNVSWTGRITH